MTRKPTNATEKAVAANSDLPPLSESELDAARKEGAKQDVQESAKGAHHFLTAGNLPGDPPSRQFTGSDEIMRFAPLLDLGIDDFTARIAEDERRPVPEEKVYGLLALERNGKNRTEYVRAMMKRLDLKAGELPGGGPDYTNDVTPVSKL